MTVALATPPLRNAVSFSHEAGPCNNPCDSGFPETASSKRILRRSAHLVCALLNRSVSSPAAHAQLDFAVRAEALKAFSAWIESKPELWVLVLTHFLHANPVSTSLENALAEALVSRGRTVITPKPQVRSFEPDAKNRRPVFDHVQRPAFTWLQRSLDIAHQSQGLCPCSVGIRQFHTLGIMERPDPGNVKLIDMHLTPTRGISFSFRKCFIAGADRYR
jgi:hypothetical protein